MTTQVFNLTQLMVIKGIDLILPDYPPIPYQRLFQYPYWCKQLILYVLKRLPTSYLAVELNPQDLHLLLRSQQQMQQMQQIKHLIHEGIHYLLPSTILPFQRSSASSQSNTRIRCCYINPTAHFQIVRIAKTSVGFLERAVPPQGQIMFEAALDDHLEIHTGNPISTILSDRIPCRCLIDR